MVSQDNLLDTLVYLLSDVSPFTRRYASAALFTLACTYANTAVMSRHCDGGILEALRKVLLNDPVDEWPETIQMIQLKLWPIIQSC